MTAKEYLSRIRKLDAIIRVRQAELERLQSEVTYISSIRYDTVRVQTSPDGSGFKIPERLYDMQRDIESKIAKLSDIRHEIIAQISTLERPEHVNLLMKRYVMCERFEQIASEMGYSYPHTVHMHGDALRAFYEKYLRST